jgi:ATP adenylyltransferase
MTYIEERNSHPGCLFCLRLAEADGPENLILHRGPRAFVILNRYPYTNGHLMVVPNDHRPSLEDLDSATLTELIELSTHSLRALRKAYGAEAFNLGANIGAAAGAGVVDHVHLHVVPRWSGDTNFMATIAEARVIPEDLPTTYRRLAEAWNAI